ncbi:MAG: hypothetical protein ACK52Z_13045, partial [Acidobacteriota bacterium]
FPLLRLDLLPTRATLRPRPSLLTARDSHLPPARTARFLLPGDGNVEYPADFHHLRQRPYRGWFLVEIRRQLQTAPGYDPTSAARRSYAAMSRALAAAHLRP